MLSLLLAALLPPAAYAADPPVTALVGGTVIDVSHGGTSTHDVAGAVVLLQGTQITAMGSAGQVAIPPGATVVHIDGKFVIPGLVDGFTGMQNQAEANAELYEGVTTVGASGDDRRGAIDFAADPSPHVYPVDSAGTTDDWSLLRPDPAWRDRLADAGAPHETVPAETTAQVDETIRRGAKIIWIGHNITQANAAAIIAQARAHHVATYGEFVATPYQAGIAAGVNVLLHMSRLELGLAPADLLARAQADPDGRGASPAYLSINGVDPAGPEVAAYAELIASHHVALMPTFSLAYAVMPSHRNLWHEPAAALLDPKTMIYAADPKTGEVPFPSLSVRASMTSTAMHSFAIDTIMIGHHVPVLAASGASWEGTLPGISMHTELELLTDAGLDARQALAAATGNYAEMLGWSELGAVEPGRRADVVVLNRDPRQNVRNVDAIDAVYVSGIRVDREGMVRGKGG